MANRTNHSSWPSSRGPWHEVIDLRRLYDHGMPWCVNVDGHPDLSDRYPDSTVHVPFDECRSASVYFDAAGETPSGEPQTFEIYLARPFRFGELRRPLHDETLLVVALANESTPDDRVAARFSMPLGEALRLARGITRLVDLVNNI